MSDLFEAAGLGPKPQSPAAEAKADDTARPLADRLRPQRLEDVVGQDHVVAADSPLGRMIKAGRLSSLILWGPPGTGKTTIARLLAQAAGYDFEQISAIFSGVADLKKVFEAARQRRRMGRRTLLFVDEIHRFNRAQQDGFLPYVEDGTVVLVGATTENPSFELNAALLSRAQVLVLNRLGEEALERLLQRAEGLIGKPLPLTAPARAALIDMADGDGRYLLNLAEELLMVEAAAPLDIEGLTEIVQRRAPLYDKAQEGHYNLISALHKSMRGSDVDAALYWYARMLAGGEGPLYIARRLVRFAVEDIGIADPQALVVANGAKEAYDFLGSPEGELAIANAVIYLATAPKSNAAYTAYKAAVVAARETGSLMPPKHILNAPTKLMKQLGYSAGYSYDHDAPDEFSGQDYFPEAMGRRQFYDPKGKGFEHEIRRRLDHWADLRRKRREREEGVNARLDQPLAQGEAARFFEVPGPAAMECLVARFHTHAYKPHTHDDYVIGVVTAGHELFSVGRERGAAGAGDIILIDPGVVHDGAPAPGGYVYRMTYPGAAVLAEIAGDLAERAMPAPHFPKALIHDAALAARLVALHQAGDAGADRLALDQAMIGTMAAVMARHGAEQKRIAAGLQRPAGREAQATARALDYLDSHYTEVVDLARLSAVASLPRARLIRALHRETGLTPHAWLTDRRVKAARPLLAAGRSPAEVALDCGFCDQSHLNRAFKARVGVTPGAYQRAKGTGFGAFKEPMKA